MKSPRPATVATIILTIGGGIALLVFRSPAPQEVAEPIPVRSEVHADVPPLMTSGLAAIVDVPVTAIGLPAEGDGNKINGEVSPAMSPAEPEPHTFEALKKSGRLPGFQEFICERDALLGEIKLLTEKVAGLPEAEKDAAFERWRSDNGQRLKVNRGKAIHFQELSVDSYAVLTAEKR